MRLHSEEGRSEGASVEESDIAAMRSRDDLRQSSSHKSLSERTVRTEHSNCAAFSSVVGSVPCKDANVKGTCLAEMISKG